MFSAKVLADDVAFQLLFFFPLGCVVMIGFVLVRLEGREKN